MIARSPSLLARLLIGLLAASFCSAAASNDTGVTSGQLDVIAAQPKSVSCDSPSPLGQYDSYCEGLRVDYFLVPKQRLAPSLTGLTPNISTFVPNLNGTAASANFKGISAAAAAKKYSFAVRYTGVLFIDQSGMYNFQLNSPAGTRLTVNGNTVTFNQGSNSSTPTTGYRFSKAGYIPIELVFFNENSIPNVSLQWQGPLDQQYTTLEGSSIQFNCSFLQNTTNSAPIVSSSLCSGLSAVYYSNWKNDSYALATASADFTLNEPALNHWSTDTTPYWSGLPSTLHTKFAARYHGQLWVPLAGKYTFKLSAVQNASLYLGSQNILNSTAPNRATLKAPMTAAFEFASAGYYPLGLNYVTQQAGKPGSLRLVWMGPNSPAYKVVTPFRHPCSTFVACTNTSTNGALPAPVVGVTPAGSSIESSTALRSPSLATFIPNSNVTFTLTFPGLDAADPNVEDVSYFVREAVANAAGLKLESVWTVPQLNDDGDVVFPIGAYFTSVSSAQRFYNTVNLRPQNIFASSAGLEDFYPIMVSSPAMGTTIAMATPPQPARATATLASIAGDNDTIPLPPTPSSPTVLGAPAPNVSSPTPTQTPQPTASPIAQIPQAATPTPTPNVTVATPAPSEGTPTPTPTAPAPVEGTPAKSPEAAAPAPANPPQVPAPTPTLGSTVTAPAPAEPSPTDAMPIVKPVPSPSATAPAPAEPLPTPTATAAAPGPAESSPSPTAAAPAPAESVPSPTAAAPAPESTPSPTAAAPTPAESVPSPTATAAAPTPAEAVPSPTATTAAPTPAETVPSPTAAAPAPAEPVPSPTATAAAPTPAEAVPSPTASAPAPAEPVASPTPQAAIPAPVEAPTPTAAAPESSPETTATAPATAPPTTPETPTPTPATPSPTPEAAAPAPATPSQTPTPGHPGTGITTGGSRHTPTPTAAVTVSTPAQAPGSYEPLSPTTAPGASGGPSTGPAPAVSPNTPTPVVYGPTPSATAPTPATSVPAATAPAPAPSRTSGGAPSTGTPVSAPTTVPVSYSPSPSATTAAPHVYGSPAPTAHAVAPAAGPGSPPMYSPGGASPRMIAPAPSTTTPASPVAYPPTTGPTPAPTPGLFGTPTPTPYVPSVVAPAMGPGPALAPGQDASSGSSSPSPRPDYQNDGEGFDGPGLPGRPTRTPSPGVHAIAPASSPAPTQSPTTVRRGNTYGLTAPAPAPTSGPPAQGAVSPAPGVPNYPQPTTAPSVPLPTYGPHGVLSPYQPGNSPATGSAPGVYSSPGVSPSPSSPSPPTYFVPNPEAPGGYLVPFPPNYPPSSPGPIPYGMVGNSPDFDGIGPIVVPPTPSPSTGSGTRPLYYGFSPSSPGGRPVPYAYYGPSTLSTPTRPAPTGPLFGNPSPLPVSAPAPAPAGPNTSPYTAPAGSPAPRMPLSPGTFFGSAPAPAPGIVGAPVGAPALSAALCACNPADTSPRNVKIEVLSTSYNSSSTDTIKFNSYLTFSHPVQSLNSSQIRVFSRQTGEDGSKTTVPGVVTVLDPISQNCAFYSLKGYVTESNPFIDNGTDIYLGAGGANLLDACGQPFNVTVAEVTQKHRLEGLLYATGIAYSEDAGVLLDSNTLDLALAFTDAVPRLSKSMFTFSGPSNVTVSDLEHVDGSDAYWTFSATVPESYFGRISVTMNSAGRRYLRSINPAAAAPGSLTIVRADPAQQGDLISSTSMANSTRG